MLRKAILVILFNAFFTEIVLATEDMNNEGINQQMPSIEIMQPFVVHLEKPKCCVLDNKLIIDSATQTHSPSNLTNLITNNPSVSQNGQGGHFQNYSIRGVSKHRIKTLINGMRIESDRRAGVSASFIDPQLIEQVIIWRNPASTQFGSGALGGAVEIEEKKFATANLATGYQSRGNENYQLLGSGGDQWSFAMARRQASNANAADGSELNTHFTQYSATLNAETEWQGLNFEFFALPAIAKDIGKSNIDFPQRITTYPEEKHLLVKLAVSSPTGVAASFYLHPNDLDTEVLKLNKSFSTISNEAIDFGANWQIEKHFDEYIGRLGLDYFSRQSVSSKEASIDLITQNQSISHTLVDGEEYEIAVVADLSGVWEVTEWKLAGRFAYFEQSAAQVATQDDFAWSGSLALSHPFDNGLEISVNAATGYRFPSLSEHFFSGTTGRGKVVANANLKKEQSVNIDIGAKWQGDQLMLATNIFYLNVSDYIERVEIEDDVLTYINLNNGKIKGIELQGDYYLTDELNLTWSGHYLKGEDDQGKVLSDIPSNRFVLGVNYNINRWEGKVNLEMRANKDDIGSGEKQISSAQILSAMLSYKFNQNLEISVNGNNLLNEQYVNSADRKATFSGERAVGVKVSWKLKE